MIYVWISDFELNFEKKSILVCYWWESNKNCWEGNFICAGDYYYTETKLYNQLNKNSIESHKKWKKERKNINFETKRTSGKYQFSFHSEK